MKSQSSEPLRGPNLQEGRLTGERRRPIVVTVEDTTAFTCVVTRVQLRLLEPGPPFNPLHLRTRRPNDGNGPR